jgi:hypothetical protein
MAAVRTDTFRAYLATRRRPRDPVAARFLAEAKVLISTGKFPRINSLTELAMYLRHAPLSTTLGAASLWRDFQFQMRTRTRRAA